MAIPVKGVRVVSMIARAVALASLVVSSNAVAAPTQPKQPTGKWLVEFADHECLLSRYYGTQKSVLILGFRKLPMQTGIELIVLRTGKRPDLSHGKARVSFRPGAAFDADYGAHRVGSDVRTINVGIEDDSYRAATKSGAVHLNIPGELQEDFAVPGLEPALQLLDQCAVNLGEVWGIPKDQQQRVGRPAKLVKSWNSLFDSSDYPTGAIRQNASGRTVVRYMVDDTGRPSDCVVLKSSGNKLLDSATCSKLMKRARFEPALDIGGKPIRSIAVTAINWLLIF